MTLSIAAERNASHAEWDAMWKACDTATYFQSRAWAQIWSAYHPGHSFQPKPLLLEFSDNRRALLPLSRQTRFLGLLQHYVLCPAGTFGAWLTESPLTTEHAQLIVQYLTKNSLRRSLTWRLSPYVAELQAIDIPFGEKSETLALALNDDFTQILKGWSKGHRSAANKARNAGVTIRKADLPNDWQEYYAVYLDSMTRWGEKAKTQFSQSLFELIREHGANDIKLWLAEYNGTIIAGALCLYSNKHVAYWHGASRGEYFKLRPANLLMYEAIKQACEQGYDWFDFNPSVGLEGVRAFKKSFGAKPYPSPVIRKHSQLYRIPKSMMQLFRNGKQILTPRS